MGLAKYSNLQIDSNSQRRWDGSLMSKDEANAVFVSKREALVKRERIKEYSLTQRVIFVIFDYFRLPSFFI